MMPSNIVEPCSENILPTITSFFTVIRNLANLNYLFLYLNYLQNLLWYWY